MIQFSICNAQKRKVKELLSCLGQNSGRKAEELLKSLINQHGINYIELRVDLATVGDSCRSALSVND